MIQDGKIVVVRGGAIGDFIVTLPILSAVRNHWPDGRLEIIGQQNVIPLSLINGLADACWPLDSRLMAEFFVKEGKLDLNMKAVFAGSRYVISYLHDPESVFAENVSRCGIGAFVCGSSFIEAGSKIHIADQLFEPLANIGVHRNVTDFHFVLNDTRSSEFWVAIHPGSGGEKKNWPEDKWAKLLIHIAAKTDYCFLIIGGEAEGRTINRLGKLLPPERTEIVQDIALVDLVPKMKSCALFMGHDSGITHLAGVLGMDRIILWGPSNKLVWGPRSGKFNLIEHRDGIESIQIDDVWTALKDFEAAQPNL